MHPEVWRDLARFGQLDHVRAFEIPLEDWNGATWILEGVIEGINGHMSGRSSGRIAKFLLVPASSPAGVTISSGRPNARAIVSITNVTAAYLLAKVLLILVTTPSHWRFSAAG
jgi:hypothetical protein